jgi:hypothetical protein
MPLQQPPQHFLALRRQRHLAAHLRRRGRGGGQHKRNRGGQPQFSEFMPASASMTSTYRKRHLPCLLAVIKCHVLARTPTSCTSVAWSSGTRAAAAMRAAAAAWRGARSPVDWNRIRSPSRTFSGSLRVLAAARQKSSRAQLRSLSGDGGVFVGCERPGVQNDSTVTHGRHLPQPPMSGTHRRRCIKGPWRQTLGNSQVNHGGGPHAAQAFQGCQTAS